MSLNRVVLIGNLSRDVESKFTWNPLHARDDYPKEEAIADNHAGGD